MKGTRSHLVTEADGIIIANPLLPLVGIWDILIINPALLRSPDEGANLPRRSPGQFCEVPWREAPARIKNPRIPHQGLRRR